MHPKARRSKRYGAELLADLETRCCAAQLRPRISAAVLGLATGPFRVLLTRWPELTLRRIELAEQWLARGIQNPYRAAASEPRRHEDSLTALS